MKQLEFLERDYQCPGSDDSITAAKRNLKRCGIPLEDIEKMTDAEKEKREELGGKLNLSGVISFYLMFGTLPLLILITFIHQIYLFF